MINMIEMIKTDEWPTGKAHEIWTKMRRPFVPDNDVAKMDMEDALAKIRLGAKEDPWDLNDKSQQCKSSILTRFLTRERPPSSCGLGRCITQQ